MSIITISNHKGGVGKTTSAISIGFGLQKLGKKVLLVDLDPQASLSQSLGIENYEKDIYGAIMGKYPLLPLEMKKGISVVPSTLDLSGAEIEMSNEAGREYILSEILEPIKLNYDYILIDSPPSLGLLTLNAFVSSNKVIVPLQAEYLSLRGLSKLMEVMEKVKKRLNKNLELGGIIITQYDGRKVLNRDIVESVKKCFQEKVFQTKIRDNIALAESPARGVDIFSYNEKSHGAHDYLALAKEVLKI